MMIYVKILSYKRPQRYAVNRTLQAAAEDVRDIYPGVEIKVTDVKELSQMEKYTDVLILPSLVVNEKLVCVGRFPKKGEVVAWLQQAIEAARDSQAI